MTSSQTNRPNSCWPSCERISNQNDQVDYYDAHDVAIHYFMALSGEQSEKEDLFAGKVKDALDLPDPAASIERMAHPELNTWYHLRYYDPMAKQKIGRGVHLGRRKSGGHINSHRNSDRNKTLF